MASDLMTIASSGAKAARAALDVTAQNIANASSEGYVRRSATLTELSAPSILGQIGDASLSGVRLDRVVRNADQFRISEMRRTTSDLSRANAELSGLENIESSLENAQVYPAFVDFEGTLEGLAADPTDLSLRASVLASAQTLARSFNVASTSLDAAAASATFDANAAVGDVNIFAQELARINLRLSRAERQHRPVVAARPARPDAAAPQRSRRYQRDGQHRPDGRGAAGLGRHRAAGAGRHRGRTGGDPGFDGTLSFTVGGSRGHARGRLARGPRTGARPSAGFPRQPRRSRRNHRHHRQHGPDRRRRA